MSLLAVVAAGCSGQPASYGAAAPTPASAGAPVARPSATATRLPDRAFDDGQVVYVTSHGVRPHWLVSIVHQAIVWRNMSGRPIRVVFDHQPIASGRIPPGAAYQYRPDNVFSFTYRVEGLPHVGGAVQVSEPLGG